MKTWNILDYGACYSDQLQTEKIQKAIDDCFLAGGGRVVIPCGIYVTGDLRIRSGVELYLESGAILQGSRNPEDYYHYRNDPLEPVIAEEAGSLSASRSTVITSRWCNALIRAINAHDFAVVGEKGSYFDGQNCFDEAGEEHYRGPHGMCFWSCENIRLEGYTFLNSSNWCHAIFKSRGITVRNITVYGGHDGVDVRTCDTVLIEDCVFHTGDDCVAGFDNNDVVVRNCVINTACQAFRFGGNNVLFENCVSEERRFGFRMKLTDEEKRSGELSTPACRHDMTVPFSYYCDHRADPRKPVEHMVIRSCRFMQAKELIRLHFDGLHRWCCNRSLREITYANCEVRGLIRPGKLWGDENEKVTFRLKNVRISAAEGHGNELLLVAGNFDKIIFEDCIIEGYDDPTILVGTDGEIELIRSTSIKVRRGGLEECLEAHPWGIIPEDRAAGRVFR